MIRLCESLSINRFDQRVSIYQRGVSSVTNQPLRVVIPASNPGEARMQDINVTIDETNSRNVYTALTTTITLDQFAQEHGWLNAGSQQRPPLVSVPLLKLDVEGHEPHIIAGAKMLLCSGIVMNVLLEFNRMHTEESQTAIDTLIDCGFVAVHQDKDVVEKKTRDETKPYLNEIKEWGERTRQNVDLWFQRADVSFGSTLPIAMQ